MGILNRMFGPEARAISAVQNWQRERTRSGASPESLMDEAQLRLAMAGVRDVASAATYADPAGAHEHVQAALLGEMQRLGALDKALARKFKTWAKMLSLEDVLHPGALAAHRATYSDLLKDARAIDPGLVQRAFGR